MMSTPYRPVTRNAVALATQARRGARALLAGAATSLLAPACCPVEPPLCRTPASVDIGYTNGLSDAERQAYYQFDEGIQYLPFDVLASLRRPEIPENASTFRLYKVYDEGFLECPDRLGLIPSPRGGSTPPIGISVSREAGYVPMAGLNCSTCHTSTMSVRDAQGRETAVVVDGGSSLFAIDRFISEMAFALLGTIANPAEFVRFYERYQDAVAKRLQSTSLQPMVWRTEKMASPLSAELTEQERDELEALFEAPEFEAFQAQAERGIPVAPLTTKPVADMSATLSSRGNKLKLPAQGDPAPQAKRLAARTTQLRDAYPTPDDLKGPFRMYAYLFRRFLHFVSASDYAEMPPGATAAGLGRSNPWSVTRRLLAHKVLGLPKNQWPAAVSAPITPPHIWEYEKYHHVFWSGVTNSMIERNFAQGVALVTDFDWGPAQETTVSARKLEAISVLARKISAPRWPQAFGAPDAALALQGKQLFDTHCVKCHSPESEQGGPAGTRLRYRDVGTDGSYVRSQLDPVGPGGLFPLLAGWLGGVKSKAYAREGISPADQVSFEQGRVPTEWRAPGPGAIEARPLHGIWASPPYLHNGAVRTIRDLLNGKRETEFEVGTYEYDTKDLGFKSVEIRYPGYAGKGLRRAAEPGNGNGGHDCDPDCGTRFTEAQKDAVIEFLKTY